MAMEGVKLRLIKLGRGAPPAAAHSPGCSFNPAESPVRRDRFRAVVATWSRPLLDGEDTMVPCLPPSGAFSHPIMRECQSGRGSAGECFT